MRDCEQGIVKLADGRSSARGRIAARGCTKFPKPVPLVEIGDGIFLSSMLRDTKAASWHSDEHVAVSGFESKALKLLHTSACAQRGDRAGKRQPIANPLASKMRAAFTKEGAEFLERCGSVP